MTATLPRTPELQKRLAAWPLTKPAHDFLGWLTSQGLYVCRMVAVDPGRCGVCGHFEEDHLHEDGTCLDCVGTSAFFHPFETLLLARPEFAPLGERPEHLVCRWQGIDADLCAAEMRAVVEAAKETA